jgi:hypothetical protein
MADITDIERLNYYEGEYLGAIDFEAEQEYHRDMRRRHNLGPHTWGIISGLDVAQFPNGGPNKEVDVFIQPGVAVDGYGREVVVLAPYQLTADMFADFPGSQSLSIWICYTQQMISPSPDACTSRGKTNTYSRVQESFQIVIEPLPPEQGAIVVAGNEVALPTAKGWKQPAPPPPTLPANEGDVVLPFDGSVAFQSLPDDSSSAIWLISLGKVYWDGANQRFLKLGIAATNYQRQYAGTVSAVIDAPVGSLTIKDRSTPSPLPDDARGTDVEIEGALTIDRLMTAKNDVWIDGHKLYFKTADGTDGNAILDIQRINNSTGAELHIHIGDNSDPNYIPKLTVGYGQPGVSETDVFTVGADGNVTIPIGSLSFGDQQSQMLNLNGTGYGIGVQQSTLFLRSESDFAFYVGGSWDAGRDKPGNGGSVSAILDSSGDLTLTGALAIDSIDRNNAALEPGLTFGFNSGEGIASKRTANGNRYGLDFYTGFAPRMCIANSGNVGIGTSAPDAPLNIAGGNWDLKSTEGDLKIGNGTYRLKMGVALGSAGNGPGAGPGDSYIRAVSAAGGTNRLLLGTGTANVLTISGSNVGIGTTTPGHTFDVTGDAKISQTLTVSGDIIASQSLTVSGSVTGGAATFSSVAFDNNVIISSGTVSELGFSSPCINVSNGDLCVHGNLVATGYKLGYVVDQFYNRGKKPFETGDLVVIHSNPKTLLYGSKNRIPLVEVALASKAGDTRVCGIVDDPTIAANLSPGLDRSALGDGFVGVMVTLGAYANCKVTAAPAPIESGDLLMASNTPGHAQKATLEAGLTPGAVIGKALAPLKKGTGIIPVLISHQ